MSLTQEFEPPSPERESGSNAKNFFGVIQKYIQSTISKMAKVDFFAWPKRKIARTFAHLWIIFSVFKKLPIAQYLPHIVMVFFVLLVLGSNINDRVMASFYANSLIETDPASQIAIAGEVGKYTPQIANSDINVDRALSSNISADGFAIKSAAVETNITMREEPLPDNSKETILYTVKNGDTLTTIGWKFDVKLATIKYVNDIENTDAIRPGTKLKISPKNYEVSPALIAKKENEKKAKQLALVNRNTVTRAQASDRSTGTGPNAVSYSAGSKSNGYPYGYCTYYVATRRAVPTHWGDAKRWLTSAKNAGYATGGTPAPGAIMVSSESWWGHVSFVESVDGNQFTIAEMNYKGWGVTSRRTLSVGDHVIRGFIY